MDNNIQLFRQFLSNQFKGGGKKNKGHSRPSYNEQTFLQDYNTAWKGTRYDTPEWRTFWTKLAKRESSFNPQVMNSIGAKGYFQLMPYNRSSTWQNNTQQFAEADKLIRSMEAKITADDLRRAEALGLNKQALLAGAWLGGIGGMRAALRGKTRADKNGTTIMSRMKDFNNLVIQPQIDPVEQYLNTPIGSHIIDNPIYATGDQYSSQVPITARVDSNTSVQEVEPFGTELPEVVVTAPSPQRKAIAQQLLNYGIQNQPQVASILVQDNNIPTITDKVAVLSQADTNKMVQDIEDAIIRQNIEQNFANSQFTHFFDEDQAAKQRDQIQDLRFRRAMNNNASNGGKLFPDGGNLFYDGREVLPEVVVTANYPTEDQIKATIESQWASAKNLPFYNITKDSTFTRERTGAGSIEYFNEPSITYDNGVTIKNPNNNPTILFDPNTNTVDDIKLDLLHHYREYDPVYQQKLNAYQSALMSDKNTADNVLWNSQLGQVFMDEYAKRDKEGNITNWEDWDTLVQENKDNPEYLIQGIDGSLRNLLANEHTIQNSNYQPLQEAVQQWLSSENAKKAFNDLNNYLVTGKENYAYGGFKGNMYDGEGDEVNLLHVAADVGTDMIPFVGTAKDAYKLYQEPSLANAGWLALSVATDLVPFLKPVKALKATKAATKAAKAAEEAQIAIIRNEVEKAAERVAKLRNTPNINPRKVRRAEDQYATYLNMIPKRVPQGWAIDRAAEKAAFNYLLKYQIPKAVVEGIGNTSEEILQKALGGPLFNSRTPIESFQGGKQLPTVRY